MGDHSLLTRLQEGEAIPLDEFTRKYDDVTKLILENGGFSPCQEIARGFDRVTGRFKEASTYDDGRKDSWVKKLISNEEGDCYVSPAMLC